MAFEIGTTVGDYQIVSTLGAGGMGKVYKVRNVISDRVEAMKVLLPDLASDHELADRFMREIKVQASLEHPNIATLHTALRIDNQLLMLMEFVEGVSLEQKTKDGPLPAAEAVDYISQVLAALDYAHKHGVVHRDIKPANMMLTPGGIVKLMDFGIAKAATDRRLTMTGTTMGSLYYMSPEQIQGAADLDARADLYSVGVSLYELVTGKRPFDGDSQFAIMSAHLEKQPVPPVTIDPKLPQALNDAILMAVAKDRATRFQTAAAFRAALSNVGGGLRPAPAVAKPAAATVVAPPPPRPASPPPITPPTVPQAPPPKSNRGLWLAAGGLGTALAVVGLVQFGPWKSSSANVQTPAAISTPAPLTTPATQTPTPAQTTTTAPPATTAPQPSRPNQSATPARQTAVASQTPLTTQPPATQLPPATQPAVQQPPVQQQAPPQTQPPPPVKAAVDPQIREDLVMLQTRAEGIRGSLQRLQQQQAASGLGLRGDMQEANNLMGSYLQGAVAALNASDGASARNFMAKAERQIEKLEKFLGR